MNHLKIKRLKKSIYILLLICFLAALMFSCSSPASKYRTGDTVCFKLNGNKGIILRAIGNSYKISYFDNLGKNHFDDFEEEELENCSK